MAFFEVMGAQWNEIPYALDLATNQYYTVRFLRFLHSRIKH